MDIFQMMFAGDIDSIRRYIESGGDLSITDNSGYSVLNIAAVLGNKEIIRLLKEHGAKTDFFTELALGNMETVIEFLNSGCSVKAANEHGQQPLMIAAHQGHINVVKLLLGKGADINGKHAVSGNTALIGAASQGEMGMVRFLLDHGADKRITNNDGRDAVQIANSEGYADIADFIKNYRKR